MKVLFINCTYKEGSTGKIICDISKEAAIEEYRFCYENGPKSDGKQLYLIANRFEQLFYYCWARMVGLKYSTGYLPTARLLAYLRKEKPDVVHIHCPNAYTVNIPWLLNFLKRKKIPTVITNHAEFFYTGNCPHAYDCTKYLTGCGHCDFVFDAKRKFLFDRTHREWVRMKNAFDGFDTVKMVCVSKWAEERLKESPLTKHLPVQVVFNGVDTSIFRFNEKCREKLGLDIDKKIVLQVTASFSAKEDDSKGGYYFIELARKMPQCQFVVCGTNLLCDTDSIPDNLLVLGRISSQEELALYYGAADVTVITSKRETFGMACAESLCCGTPIIGFRAGGPESVALKQYSEFVEYGDVDALIALIDRIPIDICDSEKMNISNNACEEYSRKKMTKAYLDIYRSL